MCAAVVSFARIRRLYYEAGDEKGSAVDHGTRFFAQPTCHHAPEVYSGFDERHAAALLKSFFQIRWQDFVLQSSNTRHTTSPPRHFVSGHVLESVTQTLHFPAWG